VCIAFVHVQLLQEERGRPAEAAAANKGDIHNGMRA
jgi:hypothetical protein